jgi:hypothetical protein
MILFALGLGIASGLLTAQLVRAWELSGQIGCSFSDALWILDQ